MKEGKIHSPYVEACFEAHRKRFCPGVKYEESSQDSAVRIEERPDAIEKPAKPKKKISASAIIIVILGVLALAVVILGELIGEYGKYLFITEKSGYAEIKSLFEGGLEGSEYVAPIAILTYSALLLLSAAVALVRIKKPEAPVAVKVFSTIALFAILVILTGRLAGGKDVETGLWITSGLALLVSAVAYLFKG